MLGLQNLHCGDITLNVLSIIQNVLSALVSIVGLVFVIPNITQSSFGELPCPVLTGFIGFDAADFLLGTVQRSLGNAFGFCRSLDGFTQHRSE